MLTCHKHCCTSYTVPLTRRNIYHETHKGWFDEEFCEMTAKKNKAYGKMIQRRTRQSCESYRKCRRVEKRVYQRKKRAWESSQLEDVEHLRASSDTRLFFQCVNEGRAAFKSTMKSYKEEDSMLLTEKNTILHQWNCSTLGNFLTKIFQPN